MYEYSQFHWLNANEVGCKNWMFFIPTFYFDKHFLNSEEDLGPEL